MGFDTKRMYMYSYRDMVDCTTELQKGYQERNKKIILKTES